MAMMSVSAYFTVRATGSPWARQDRTNSGKAIATRANTTRKVDFICSSSSFFSGKNFEPLFKAIVPECVRSFAVVERIVGVEPIALRVHFEIRNFGDLVVFNEKLPFRNEGRDQRDLSVVQMELIFVELAVHVWVSQENLGSASFDDHVDDVGLSQLIERLRR